MKYLLTTILTLAIALTANAQTRTEQHQAFKVEVYGQGSPLYLIPGATCSGEVWKETVAHYQNKYECHVFTLAGYAGQPALPEADNYLPRHKMALENYIAEHGKGMVMGHSIGGYLAMWIASEKPALIEKLVIVDALPYLRGSMDPNAPETDPKPAAEQYYAAIKDIPAESFVQMQMPMVQGMIKDSTRWDMVANWGAQSDRRTLAYTFNEMLAQDLRDELSSLTMPVLIMGQFDKPNPMYPNMTAATIKNNLVNQYAKVENDRILVAEGSRHFIMYDAPSWFATEVDSFFAKVN